MNAVSRGNGPHVLRQLNTAAVLDALRTAGPARVAELMTRTGLTRPTVAQALSLLESEGWIVSAPDESGPRLGRPAQLVRFNAAAGYVLGVDIGPHKVLAMVADLAGTVVAEQRADTSSARTGAAVMGVARTAMRAVLDRAGVAAERLFGVALGTPGLVDASRGTVLLAPSMPGWAAIPHVDELRGQFHCPIAIDNDVNLAVLAEQRYGAAEQVDTLVFIQWGARIGAGVIIGGRLHRGAASAAGEIGFMDLDERPSPPADMGAFERTVGAAAIAGLAAATGSAAAAATSSAAAAATSSAAAARPDAEAILNAAAAGDAGALTVVDQIAARFARGIGPLLLILDPDLVIIGGGVSGAGLTLLDAVDRHLRTRTLLPPRLALSRLGDRAVALGAVRLALEDVERRLFTPAALRGTEAASGAVRAVPE